MTVAESIAYKECADQMNILWGILESDPKLLISSVQTQSHARNIAEKINVTFNVKNIFSSDCAQVIKGNSENYYVTIPRQRIETYLESTSESSSSSAQTIIASFSMKRHPTYERNRRLLSTEQVQESLKKRGLRVQEGLDSKRIDINKTCHPNKESIKTIKSHNKKLGPYDFGYATVSQQLYSDEVIYSESITLKSGNSVYTIPIFAIYDGYSPIETQGNREANAVAKKLVAELEENINKHLLKLNEKQRQSVSEVETAIFNGLKMAFVKASKASNKRPTKSALVKESQRSGTQVTTCLIINNYVWTAYVGNSKAIIAKSPMPLSTTNILGLSHETNPLIKSSDLELIPSDEKGKNVPIENILTDYLRPLKSLWARGSNFISVPVAMDTRYEMIIHRSLGNTETKESFNPRPYITRFPIISNEGRTFLILASDGLWNVFNPEEVANEVKNLGKQALSCREISYELTQKACIKENPNNISVVVVELTTPDYFKNWQYIEPSLRSPLMSEEAAEILLKKIPEALMVDCEDKRSLYLPFGKITKPLDKFFTSLQPYLDIRDKIPLLNERVYDSLQNKHEKGKNKLQTQFERANTQERLHAKTYGDWSKKIRDFVEKDVSKDSFKSAFDNIPYVEDVGIAHMLGDREEMQDDHLAIKLEVTINGQLTTLPLFGIFDGHGAYCGHLCSKFIAENLKEYLEEKINDTFKNKPLNDLDLFNLFKVAFVYLGRKFNQRVDIDYSGTTATVACIIGKELWAANVGDSKTILSQNHQELTQTIALSQESELTNPKFRKSVHKRGLEIYPDSNGERRVDGALNMSHSVCHDEYVSGINPRAKIIKYSLENLSDKENFLILGCDGLFDVGSSIQVSEFTQAQKHLPCEEIAKLLMEHAYCVGSRDNISVMVVNLKKPTDISLKDLQITSQ